MFEAAMQLLDEGGIAALTTNAVAARAGVGIGTLYQYFDGKQALLNALTERELSAMRDKLLDTMRGAAPARAGDRIRQLVRIVTGAYGGRTRVHRQLIEHALTLGTAGRLSPLHAQLAATFSSQGISVPGAGQRALTPAQAFVLTHAASGVLRALSAQEAAPPIAQVEEALVRMLHGYVAGVAGEGPTHLVHTRPCTLDR